MNIKRGFFRLWVVISVLWLVLCLLLAQGIPSPNHVPLVVTPPAVLFLFGWTALWALSGFKRS